MRPIPGDTYAVWIADDGLDRAHDSELLLYEVPAPVVGDVAAVWVSADGYRWAHDNRLEELTGKPQITISAASPAPSGSFVLGHVVLSAQAVSPSPAALLQLDVGLHFDIGIGAATASPSSFITLRHAPAIFAITASLAPSPSSELFLSHLQPILAAIQTETPSPSGILTVRHGRGVQIVAVSPAPATAVRLFHDWDQRPGQTVYDLTLTGTADELPDVVLPISSFQGRLRDGSPSYLQVTVPGAAVYAEAVAARPNGQLVLRKGVQFADGSRQLEEIARVNLGLISDARGPGSQTLTLSGHRTVSAAAPKTRALTGIRYRSAGSGKRRYRCAVDLFLRPGDTAEIPEFAESVTVGLITYVVSANPASETMEISEA